MSIDDCLTLLAIAKTRQERATALLALRAAIERELLATGLLVQPINAAAVRKA
jgi:hypothetical protein